MHTHILSRTHTHTYTYTYTHTHPHTHTRARTHTRSGRLAKRGEHENGGFGVVFDTPCKTWRPNHEGHNAHIHTHEHTHRTTWVRCAQKWCDVEMYLKQIGCRITKVTMHTYTHTNTHTNTHTARRWGNLHKRGVVLSCTLKKSGAESHRSRCTVSIRAPVAAVARRLAPSSSTSSRVIAFMCVTWLIRFCDMVWSRV